MFKRLKKFMAFTLAELLIVFTIIGIVSAITIMTTRRLSTTDKFSYQRAYDSLLTAAYNAVAEIDAQGISESPEQLCRGLAKYINSMRATNTEAADPDHDTNVAFEGNPDEGYCNAVGTRATINTDRFEDRQHPENTILPDFIANNGMRFYITDRITQDGVTDFTDAAMDVTFYVVFVDIDGDNGQNSVASGDVVAFAVTDNADVIPLGLPAYDTHYLGVRVVFPENSVHDDETSSESMSYYDAIRTAWGGRINFDDLRTINFSELPVLQGASFYHAAPAAVEQHDDCICDSHAPGKENCVETTNPEDRFDCDIRIQRYY